MTDKEKIEMLRKALEPFAKMDRPPSGFDDLSEIACDRGICEDMTIITSRDFRNASEVLEKTKEKYEITYEEMAQKIEETTEIPDVIIEGDEFIVPTEEITRFRWAKIYGEWTIIEMTDRGSFYTLGDEQESKEEYFEKDFEWGDWIAPPSYGPWPNGIVIE